LPNDTEQQVAKTNEKPAPAPPNISFGSKGIQIQSFDELWRFANSVIASGFAPKGMDSPASVFIAVEMGLEIGLPPMQAVQNIAVIKGRPSVWGDAVPGLVYATGQCDKIEEWFEGDTHKGKDWNDAFTAVCRVHRKGMSKDVEQRFSVADAKTADLWKKAGPWQTNPKRMLQLRARSFACRDAFPDALRGLHVAEEAQDIVDITPDQERRVESAQDALERGEKPVPRLHAAVQEASPEPGVDQERESVDPEVMELQEKALKLMENAPQEVVDDARAQAGVELLSVDDMTETQLETIIEAISGA